MDLTLEVKKAQMDIAITKEELAVEIAKAVVLQGMNTSIYDSNLDGIVDKSEIVARYYTCGEQINSLKVVFVSNGKIYKADSSDWSSIEKLVGITLQAGNLNESVLVCIRGEVRNTGWGLMEGVKYFLGADGDITTNPIGNICEIGFASDSNTLIFEKGLTIRRL
jgi:hypothetical protein